MDTNIIRPFYIPHSLHYVSILSMCPTNIDTQTNKLLQLLVFSAPIALYLMIYIQGDSGGTYRVIQEESALLWEMIV